MTRRYWLMKSEPDECSIDDALAMPDATVPWTGVRNFQARNFMRDQMRVGDGVLFHHSSCAEPGIAGIAEVASTPYPDPTQFDPSSPYFDPKSRPEAPRWMLVARIQSAPTATSPPRVGGVRRSVAGGLSPRRRVCQPCERPVEWGFRSRLRRPETCPRDAR